VNAVVRVLSEVPPRGYVGPCCHSDCSDPATVVVVMAVDDLIVMAWTCETHRPSA